MLTDHAAVGVDYDDVVRLLEREGIRKFADAWTRLLERLRSALADSSAPVEKGIS